MSTQDKQLLDKALGLHRGGQRAEAEAVYRQILSDHPVHRDALNNLGILLRVPERIGEAIAVLQQATASHPDFPEAFNSLGLAFTQAGRNDEALAAFRQALEIAPDFAVAWQNMAHLLERAGNLAQALKAIRQFLTVQPDSPDALNRLGCYLFAAEEVPPALQALVRAIELAPDNVDALVNLAMVLEKLGRYDEAIGIRQRALTHAPDDAACHNDQAISLERLGRYEEAIAARRKVLEQLPQDADSMGDLGRLLTEAGQDEQAKSWFAKALTLAPDAPRIHFNNALYLLRRGEFAEGWAEHEWRLKFTSMTNLFPNHPQPYWDGGDLTGKTIFLHGEQGWGDAIQCARFVPEVAQLAGRVILGCREPLARLFADLPGVDLVITDPDDLPDFDVRCSLMSLPYFFKADEETLTGGRPYLSAPVQEFPFLDNAKKNVGLVWGGSPTHRNDHNRSLTLQQIAPILDVPGWAFHSLQVDSRRQEIEVGGFSDRLNDAGANLTDLADTAALIAKLDLVISVDTSVAHLAGAMGKPVWILVPDPCDWRWMRDRTDSPWYPSAKLYRQEIRGDWEPVIQRLIADFSVSSMGRSS